MKLQRLLEMDRAEIFTRGMQKASKSIDRLAMTTFDARHQLPDLFDQLMADPQMDGLDNGDIEKSGISLQKQFNLAVSGIFF